MDVYQVRAVVLALKDLLNSTNSPNVLRVSDIDLVAYFHLLDFVRLFPLEVLLSSAFPIIQIFLCDLVVVVRPSEDMLDGEVN